MRNCLMTAILLVVSRKMESIIMLLDIGLLDLISLFRYFSIYLGKIVNK